MKKAINWLIGFMVILGFTLFAGIVFSAFLYPVFYILLLVVLTLTVIIFRIACRDAYAKLTGWCKAFPRNDIVADFWHSFEAAHASLDGEEQSGDFDTDKETSTSPEDRDKGNDDDDGQCQV